MKFEVPPKFSDDPFFEFCTFDWKFERSTGNSSVRLEMRTLGRKFECSTRNSNVRPEIPNTTEFFGCPVFLNFERSTGNSNVRPEIQTQYRSKDITFLTPDAFVGSFGTDFPRRIFFLIRRKFQEGQKRDRVFI